MDSLGSDGEEMIEMIIEIEEDCFHDIEILQEETEPILYTDLDPVGQIAEGGFGSVFLTYCRYRFNGHAVKLIPLEVPSCHKDDFSEQDYAALMRNELAVLSLTAEKHIPFCLSLYTFSFTDRHLRIVTEYAFRGSIFYLVEKCDTAGDFTPRMAKFYCAEMAVGVGYLHEHGIIHRDLAPQNVLIDSSGHLLISDFGLSIRAEVNNNVRVGNIEYNAPEMLLGNHYDYQVDWWSVGLVLYFMLTGKNAVWRPKLSDEDNVERIVSNRYPINWKRIRMTKDVHLIDFLKSIIVHDPGQRLGKKGFRELLRHPYLSDFSLDALRNKSIAPPLPSKLDSSRFLPDVEPLSDEWKAYFEATPLRFKKPSHIDFCDEFILL